MEKKKVTKKVTSKTSKKATKTVAKKSTTKLTKKKKGFTLIELLAVIIILGILMIIAIPSVTKYISDSRKSAYVDTALEIVGGTRNIVNEGTLGMYDTNATYYIPSSYIKTENASKSPYGEFTEAYVAVTYNGQGYNYYWISTDDAGEGVASVTPINDLDTDDIVSDLKSEEIKNIVETTSISGREKIYILDPRTGAWRSPIIASSYVSENGKRIVCIKAKTLHTATCTASSYGCYAEGYYDGGSKGTTTITYGSIPNGSPKAGDAYDCKLTSDGGYTERFYYIEEWGDGYIDLIYYKNINTGLGIAYDSSNINYEGPQTAGTVLPSPDDWNFLDWYPEFNYSFKDDEGNIIPWYDYSGKAASMPFIYDIDAACGTSTYGGTDKMHNCLFLLEGLGFFESGSGTSGYWLFDFPTWREHDVYFVSGKQRHVSYTVANNSSGNVGVRPVLMLLKDNIER